MTHRWRCGVTGIVAGLAAVSVAACGSTSSSTGSVSGRRSSSRQSASGLSALPLKAGEDPTHQILTGPTKKKGGTLTVLTTFDFAHLDPGAAYFSQDYAVMYATQRPLFSYKPDTQNVLSPDLATVVPTTANGGITDGGKTVTVHIKQGVHFSPPVDREVTSADVAYAIERAANPNVGNPYFRLYFGANAPAPLEGAQSSHYKGGPIPGIQTPNTSTIVFHTIKPSGSFLVSALGMPISMPVPESYAGPMDRKSPTTYGSKYLVATGPYMIKSDPKTGRFQGIGYQLGNSLILVRNPSWNASTDDRPAYLNQINFHIGGYSTVIGNTVLHGSNMVQYDPPAQSIVRLAYQSYPSQIVFTQGTGENFLTLNNSAGPFKNVNLRRAVWANLDRAALPKLMGGLLVAQPATHFIYPGVNGYEQAGGAAGPQVPWNRSVTGNLQVAEKYMKAAGYPSGKYTGSDVVQIIGAINTFAPAVVQVVASDMNQLGFKTHVSLLEASVMAGKYCGVPKQEIDACPNASWSRDFADPLTVLYAPFYGPSIRPSNNVNWGQVNDPQINSAMEKAALVTDPTARAQAWANVDKMLVNQAVAVPEVFNGSADVRSKDVAGVIDLGGSWDLAFTSLKNP